MIYDNERKNTIKKVDFEKFLIKFVEFKFYKIIVI